MNDWQQNFFDQRPLYAASESLLMTGRHSRLRMADWESDENGG
jgi:hypothetical protein